ncbi:MAG: ABC transporter ATP-binding protein [Defluviitaleaceae bacterium]|nr:ABC transporter ATP-binding protein [Defluviitaleaceae bacterium]
MIEMQGINKFFFKGKQNELHILKDIDFVVKKGEFVSIVGASGSGKSTLMNIIGVLDRPTSGSYFLDGIDTSTLDDNELSDTRNKKIGFVFQTFNLMPRSNVIRNVELPMLYSGLSPSIRIKRAKELLEMVGMTDRQSHHPSELSGGEKQRVAIARAMANSPSILLADEPTGSLDSTTGRMVMDIFHRLHKEQGTTIVLITHNTQLASETSRTLSLHDGEFLKQ